LLIEYPLSDFSSRSRLIIPFYASISDLKLEVAQRLATGLGGNGSKSIYLAHLAELGIIPLKKPAFPTFHNLNVRSAAE